MGLVDVYIASMWRNGHLATTINSLLKCKEVSTITAVCNNYTDVQMARINACINHDIRVTLIKGDNSKGCSEKLRYINMGSSKYIATCDDDIIYPKDYLSKLIAGVEKHNCLVSCHGRILKEGRALNYYKHKKQMFHCLHEVKQDSECDIIGSGVALFPRLLFKDLDFYNKIKFSNMTDIYLSYFAKSQGIKRIVLAHEKDWLKVKEPEQGDNYIYDTAHNNCDIQTAFINKLFL